MLDEARAIARLQLPTSSDPTRPLVDLPAAASSDVAASHASVPQVIRTPRRRCLGATVCDTITDVLGQDANGTLFNESYLSLDLDLF